MQYKMIRKIISRTSLIALLTMPLSAEAVISDDALEAYTNNPCHISAIHALLGDEADSVLKAATGDADDEATANARAALKGYGEIIMHALMGYNYSYPQEGENVFTIYKFYELMNAIAPELLTKSELRQFGERPAALKDSYGDESARQNNRSVNILDRVKSIVTHLNTNCIMIKTVC